MEIRGNEAILSGGEMNTLGIKNSNSYPISFMNEKLKDENDIVSAQIDSFPHGNATRSLMELFQKRNLLAEMLGQLLAHELEVMRI